MGQDEATASEAGPIRFDRAEFAEPDGAARCSMCGEPVRKTYFEVNGAMACTGCRQGVEAAQHLGTAPGRFLRALAAGAAAAALGAGIYYGVRALTGYEIGIVAIVVGLLVGGAVRWGAYRRGGWFYQTLAIGLTYLSVVSTYAPFVFEAFRKMDVPEPAAGAAEAAPAARESVASTTATPAAAKTGEAKPAMAPLSAGQIAVGLVAIGFILLAAPFLAGFENFMGWVLIAIALYEAWKINKRQPLVVSGPFRLTARTADAMPA